MIKPNGAKLYVLPSSLPFISESQEVVQLKQTLGSHIDMLETAEAEIKDFLGWVERSGAVIPNAVLGGLKSVLAKGA